jgi:hypothetical protein
MTSLKGPATRWVWRWCVIYTVIVPAPHRRSRREEIRSHLWESEHAGLRQREVLLASARGMAADLSWAAGAGVASALRGLLTPTPYVVLAGACPIVAWLVSVFADQRTAHPFEYLGGIGGTPFLLLALLMWKRGQSRRRPPGR